MANDLTQADFDAIVSEVSEPTITATESCMTAAGLRQAADMIERLKARGHEYYGGALFHICASTAEEFRQACRVLGTFSKNADDNFFNATRTFDGDIKVQVFIARQKVCKRVLLRVEQVPEQIIPAVPEKIIPASTREVYGWECGGSVMASKQPEQVLQEPIPQPSLPVSTADDGIPF